MGRVSSEGIVLGTSPVGEADLIVTLFTHSEGKIRGSARAARKSVRRFGGALAPLTRGLATWTESEGQELVRLESFETIVSFAERQSELAWFYLFAYVAEVTDTFARDREADERFYRLVTAASDASASGASPARVRRWFEIWTLRLQGLLPSLETCAGCGTTVPAEGSVRVSDSGDAWCERCASRGGAAALQLSGAERAWIRAALKGRPEAIADPPAGQGLERLVQALLIEFTGRPFRTARFLEA